MYVSSKYLMNNKYTHKNTLPREKFLSAKRHRPFPGEKPRWNPRCFRAWPRPLSSIPS